MYKKILSKALPKNVQYKGSLAIHHVDGEVQKYGDENSKTGEHGVVYVRDKGFYKRAVLYGSIGFGEAYFLKYYDTPDLTAVFGFLLDNRNVTPELSKRPVANSFIHLMKWSSKIKFWQRKNTKENSKENIRRHYDIGNDMYKLMLDKSMTYSSANFETGEENLYEAQMNKYENICQNIELKKGDEVLEIGCGWGGFACYAASKYGCKVTGITISRAQLEYGQQRVRDEGLEHLVNLEFRDYREIEGTYDKIVSIEMVEALGYQYFDTYFSVVHKALKDEGLACIQAILQNDHFYDTYLKNVDFISAHIFPGGRILSVYEILKSTKKTSTLQLQKFSKFGQSYSKTLAIWRDNFFDHIEEVKALGLDEQFILMWDYYLRSCQISFAKEFIDVAQLTFKKTF